MRSQHFSSSTVRIVFALVILALMTTASAAQTGLHEASPPPGQTASDAPVIDAENVTQLQPVQRIDFTALPAEIEIQTGWFVMSDNGDRIATVRRDGGMVIWTAAGELVDTFTLPRQDDLPATVLDAYFSADGERLAVISTVDGQTYSASVRVVSDETISVAVPADYGRPVRVWLDAQTPHLWIETAPTDPEGIYQVARLPYEAADDAPVLLPSGPEQDDESFVRIGRIPAPLAITSTPDGLVRLWDLETGEITSEVQLDVVPVFGRVNETTGEQLAWRDPASEGLYLLDFVTGENIFVAELGGAYVQALMLSPAADVILGVHIGDDPVVVAWDPATGEQLDLGTYRSDCTRVPDMVQLSEDGRRLVVGCDAGLEIWQVGPAEMDEDTGT